MHMKFRLFAVCFALVAKKSRRWRDGDECANEALRMAA